MAIGMSPSEFWDDDPWLAVSYKKAHRLRRERSNFDAHLQGAYVYEAFSAALACAFGDKKAKYPERPYDLFSKREEHKEPTDDRQSAAISFMQSFMASHNKKMRAAGGAPDSVQTPSG